MDLGRVAPLPPSPIPASLLDAATTLPGALATLAERFPDWSCLTILDRDRTEHTLSLRQLWARAGTIQAALVARGLRPGSCAHEGGAGTPLLGSSTPHA